MKFVFFVFFNFFGQDFTESFCSNEVRHKLQSKYSMVPAAGINTLYTKSFC